MNELDIVRDARPQTTSPSLSELAVARHTLQRAIRAETRGRTGGRHARHDHRGKALRARRRRTFPARLGAIVVAACAIATAILLVPQSKRTGLGSPSASADPVQVLHYAASIARARPDVAPRPEQYYYVRTGNRQRWYSIDGRHANGEQDDQHAAILCSSSADDYPAVSACDVGPAYDPTLPGDPAAMTEYIRARVRENLVQYVEPGRAEEEINRWEGGFVQQLLENRYLRAPVEAALYEAITQMMTVKLMTADLPAGTVGVSFDDGASALLFSAVTREYVGYLSPQDGAGGTTLDEYASGLVDRVGQTP